QLAVRRHLISGAVWAMAGRATWVAAAPRPPMPATLMNLRLLTCAIPFLPGRARWSRASSCPPPRHIHRAPPDRQAAKMCRGLSDAVGALAVLGANVEGRWNPALIGTVRICARPLKPGSIGRSPHRAFAAIAGDRPHGPADRRRFHRAQRRRNPRA